VKSSSTAKAPHPPEHGPAAGRLIAVVDDEPDILDLVSLHLKRAGFRVSTFADGGGFFRFITDHVPDLVLLDLMLPDIDGFAVCEILRRSAATAAIPILILSAWSTPDARLLGLDLGALDYVPKPFSPKDLVARVNRLLRPSPASA